MVLIEARQAAVCVGRWPLPVGVLSRGADLAPGREFGGAEDLKAHPASVAVFELVYSLHPFNSLRSF